MQPSQLYLRRYPRRRRLLIRHLPLLTRRPIKVPIHNLKRVHGVDYYAD